MGAEIENEDVAIKEFRSLSTHAKQTLHHHLANSLTPIMAHGQMLGNQVIVDNINHILEDLVKFGIRETGLRY